MRAHAPVTHLLCEDISGVVDGAEAAVADLAQVLKHALRVIALKQVSDFRVLQTASPDTNTQTGQRSPSSLDCQP